MRVSTLMGGVMLVALLSACQTTEDGAASDGAEIAAPDAGLANDAVVRVQVEDYQLHLTEIIHEYRFCVRATALEIDDGVSDPAAVIDQAQRRCEDEYRTVHRTANLLNNMDRISSLRAESQAAALDALMSARAPS